MSSHDQFSDTAEKPTERERFRWLRIIEDIFLSLGLLMLVISPIISLGQPSLFIRFVGLSLATGFMVFSAMINLIRLIMFERTRRKDELEQRQQEMKNILAQK
jgi:hypothetical protein